MSTHPATVVRNRVLAATRRYVDQAKLNSSMYYSKSGTVLFFEHQSTAGTLVHGNFHPDAFSAIAANDGWASRLRKPHPQRGGLPSPHSNSARELDSCTSSDALLMNVFCSAGAPDVFGRDISFGQAGEVPLKAGHTDRTELDIATHDWVVEAKLTERTFTDKARAVVESYRDFDTLFRTAELLDGNGTNYQYYQLIRNVLAAHASGRRSAVIIDVERVDLRDAWNTVVNAVVSESLRRSCRLLTWQDLAAQSAVPIRDFMMHKYGIFPNFP